MITLVSTRVQVLLDGAVAEQFERYYREHGFKKSTPIARLNREHLGREGFPAQLGLFTAASKPRKSRA